MVRGAAPAVAPAFRSSARAPRAVRPRTCVNETDGGDFRRTEYWYQYAFCIADVKNASPQHEKGRPCISALTGRSPPLGHSDSIGQHVVCDDSRQNSYAGETQCVTAVPVTVSCQHKRRWPKHPRIEPAHLQIYVSLVARAGAADPVRLRGVRGRRQYRCQWSPASHEGVPPRR